MATATCCATSRTLARRQRPSASRFATRSGRWSASSSRRRWRRSSTSARTASARSRQRGPGRDRGDGTIHAAGISQARISRRVREQLETSGIGVAATTTSGDITGTIFTLFDTLVSPRDGHVGPAGRGRWPGACGDDDHERRGAVARNRCDPRGGRNRLSGPADLPDRGAPGGLLAWTLGVLLSLPSAGCCRMRSARRSSSGHLRPIRGRAWHSGSCRLWLSTLGSLLPAWRASGSRFGRRSHTNERERRSPVTALTGGSSLPSWPRSPSPSSSWP